MTDEVDILREATLAVRRAENQVRYWRNRRAAELNHNLRAEHGARVHLWTMDLSSKRMELAKITEQQNQ